ncbi:DUF4227 family protein [Paenibacillus tarimensis]
MVVSLRKVFSLLSFAILFILLTLLVSGGYRWLLEKVSFTDRYEAPQGQALKVFQGEATVTERLRWFYLYGE